MENARGVLRGPVSFSESLEECVRNAAVIVIPTS
jgi:hypothetical protein